MGKYEKIRDVTAKVNNALACVFWCAVAISFLGWCATSVSVIVFGIVVAVVSKVGIVCLGKIHVKADEQITKIYTMKVAAAREAEEKIIAQGGWTFPCERLFLECEKNGVFAIETDFSISKAVLITNKILKESISEKYIDLYNSENKVKEYFLNGKQAVEKERNTPKKVELPLEKKKQNDFSEQIKNLTGTNKRVAILNNAIEELEEKIIKYREGMEAMKQLGVLMSTSIAQTPKKDWSLIGGIVSGIAGPVAGAVAASEAIAENENIEMQNRQARVMAQKTINEMYQHAYSTEGDIEEFYKEKALLRHFYDESNTKVVLNNFSTSELFEKMQFTPEVKKTEIGKGLDVCINVFNDFEIELQEKVELVIDGTFDVEIYCDGQFLDSVCVALPMFGVGTFESVHIHAYSGCYMESSDKYTVKIKPNNLWVMER